jgi:hypothetical protein
MYKKESKNQLPYLDEIESLINHAIGEIRKLSHSLIAPSLKNQNSPGF